MPVERMREHVAAAYDSQVWRNRVMHLMPDNQVIAIYHTMLERRQIRPKRNRRRATDGVRCEQLSIFDLLKEKE